MLEGTLATFTLPDIFTLLSQTKKSGALSLEHAGTSGAVWFDQGQVAFATSTPGRLALGRRLVGAGLLTTADVEKALSEQEALRADGHGLRIGQVLRSNGAIDADTLATYVREQIQDAVFDLLRWTDGTFRFAVEEPGFLDESITLTESVENLIMEGSRRLDEWELVARKVPSTDALVTLASPAGADDVDIQLRPEEWRLLTFVDGERTVGDLVALFGQGEFATCKVLYGLVETGLLRVASDDDEALGADLVAQQALLAALEGDTPVVLPPRPAGRESSSAAAADAPASSAADEPPMPPATAPIDVSDGSDDAATATEEGGIDADLVHRLIAGVQEL